MSWMHHDNKLDELAKAETKRERKWWDVGMFNSLRSRDIKFTSKTTGPTHHLTYWDLSRVFGSIQKHSLKLWGGKRGPSVAEEIQKKIGYRQCCLLFLQSIWVGGYSWLPVDIHYHGLVYVNESWSAKQPSSHFTRPRTWHFKRCNIYK